MPGIKIAYILSKFPVFTETFIIREIREIRRRGIDVEVFSLKSAAGDKSKHAEAEELRADTHYIPFIFSLEVWQSVLYYLGTRPRDAWHARQNNRPQYFEPDDAS